MIIEKIFSELDTNERLYSVLMDEDEIALFSEFQERYYGRIWDGVKNAYNKYKFLAATTAIPLSIAGGGTYLTNRYIEPLDRKYHEQHMLYLDQKHSDYINLPQLTKDSIDNIPYIDWRDKVDLKIKKIPVATKKISKKTINSGKNFLMDGTDTVFNGISRVINGPVKPPTNTLVYKDNFRDY